MSQIIYVDEYEPSSASLEVGQDPIYKVSAESEQIRVRALQAPMNYVGPILLIGSLAAVAYLIWRS